MSCSCFFVICDCSGVSSQNQERDCTQMFSKQPCMNGSQETPLFLSEEGTVGESQQESSGPGVDLNVL